MGSNYFISLVLFTSFETAGGRIQQDININTKPIKKLINGLTKKEVIIKIDKLRMSVKHKIRGFSFKNSFFLSNISFPGNPDNLKFPVEVLKVYLFFIFI